MLSLSDNPSLNIQEFKPRSSQNLIQSLHVFLQVNSVISIVGSILIILKLLHCCGVFIVLAKANLSISGLLAAFGEFFLNASSV